MPRDSLFVTSGLRIMETMLDDAGKVVVREQATALVLEREQVAQQIREKRRELHELKTRHKSLDGQVVTLSEAARTGILKEQREVHLYTDSVLVWEQLPGGERLGDMRQADHEEAELVRAAVDKRERQMNFDDHLEHAAAGPPDAPPEDPAPGEEGTISEIAAPFLGRLKQEIAVDEAAARAAAEVERQRAAAQPRSPWTPLEAEAPAVPRGRRGHLHAVPSPKAGADPPSPEPNNVTQPR